MIWLLALLSNLICLIGCKSFEEHNKEVEIKGIVYDTNNGSPLNNAIIKNMATDECSLSDENGYFIIKGTNGDSINISYIGMISLTIPISQSDSIKWNVGLREYGAIIEPMLNKSYSTYADFQMTVENQEELRLPLDSIILKLKNTSCNVVTYGDYFEIQENKGGGWREVPYDEKYRDKDGCINVVFNSIAYPVKPNTTSIKVEKPWVYGSNIGRGRYRIAKDFIVGNNVNVKDTVYFEFDLR